tara:strand:- start:504 stop:1289 length:786 start_codon:yes stop_codon:yes gene_type:complete
MIQGVRNNLSFLSVVMSNKDFKDGNISTSFIEQNFSKGFKGISFKKHEEIIYLSLLALNFDQINRNNREKKEQSNFFVEIIDEFDGQKYLSKEYSINVEGNFFSISQSEGIKIYNKIYKGLKIRFEKSFENNFCHFHFISEKEIILDFYCDIQFMHPFTVLKFRGVSIYGMLKNKNSVSLSKYLKETKSLDSSKLLKCPMPGKLIEVLVKVGLDVEAGDKLCIVEAMKMENVLLAPKSGKVKKINYKVNDILSVGSVIMEF